MNYDQTDIMKWEKMLNEKREREREFDLFGSALSA